MYVEFKAPTAARGKFLIAKLGNSVPIAVDCSGSVNSWQLSLFEAEIRSILESQRPQRVHVLYFDSKVNKWNYEAGQPVHLNPDGRGREPRFGNQ